MSKNNAVTPLMRQYYEIKALHKDAILLFRVGDFYETFAEDAIATSKILGITLTKRANGIAQFIELAGFPFHALDTYLPKLVKAGKRVAVCDQLEDPKKTKTIVKRGITELVTPGVVINDNILDNRENNYLAAVMTDRKGSFAISFLDISTGEFIVSQGSCDYINKLIINYQPKELLINDTQKTKITEHIDYNGYIFDLDDWAFSYDNNRDLLCRHFQVNTLKGFGIDEMPLSISVSGAILNYLDSTNHKNISHITSLRRIDKNGYVRLDSFTLRSLEIINRMDSNASCLFDIINKTETPMGTRTLRKWLVFPLTEIGIIRERQKLVSALFADKETLSELKEVLSEIGDIERLIGKASVGRISPRDTINLATSLLAIDDIKTLLAKSKATELSEMAKIIDCCKELSLRIKKEIRPDAPIALGKGPSICPGVSNELDEYRSLLTNGKEYLIQMQQRESENTGIPSLKISFNNVFGYYIEVRNTHKDKVPQGWIRKQTLVNAERYITEELKHYEEKILKAEDAIASIEYKIFNELVEYINSFIVKLQKLSEQIAYIDCIQSLAAVARENNYVCPFVTESHEIKITDGRHPVIEKQLPHNSQYIPNDVVLDNSNTQIMIITGPNMSGKSALLRQTALIVLLAQVGSFVPASHAEIGIVDGIFTRVGASDNISRGESTFMVEMQEASNILNNITDRSLILFDELGRGTATYDGISIAWAIVEYLHNSRQKPKTLFATHYHELNEIENRMERVKNYNVSAKEIDGKMLFLRKLERGGSEHSFGIQVAKLGGMPKKIITRATDILSQLENEHTIDIPKMDDMKITKTKKIKDNDNKSVQMSIFQLEDPLLEDIRERLLNVNINELTPIEALNKLYEIQKLLKGY